MNIILCDDNLLHLNYTMGIAKKILTDPNTNFFCYHSAEDILSAMDTYTYTPHIAILDIELGGKSGIDLARQINAHFPACQIVFISSHSGYASDVYQADHVWFVLKNRITEYLPQAIEKAVSALHDTPNSFAITVKQNHTMQKIAVDRIFFMERVAHRTRITAVDGTIVVWQSPVELLQALPGNTFIHCHQSFWVNRAKISAYAGNDFHLIDGSVIPISRTYKKEALAAFHSGQPAD